MTALSDEARRILTDARALLADPKGWTQGENARTAAGTPAFYESPEAVCFCAVGAIFRAAGSVNTPAGIFTSFRALTRGKGLVYYNDTHTHAEVLALFDAALA